MILRSILISLAFIFSVASSNAASPSNDIITGEEVVKTAMKYLGLPYRSGMSGPKGFDCSGFTRFIFDIFHIDLDHGSRAQYTQGVSVDRKDLRVGDLVFFTSPRSGRAVGHVGIVSEVEENGNFHFVHAARRGVIVDDYATSSYYNGRYVGARRVLSD